SPLCTEKTIEQVAKCSLPAELISGNPIGLKIVLLLEITNKCIGSEIIPSVANLICPLAAGVWNRGKSGRGFTRLAGLRGIVAVRPREGVVSGVVARFAIFRKCQYWLENMMFRARSSGDRAAVS